MAEYQRVIHTSDAVLRVSDTGGRGMPLLMIHGSGSNRHAFVGQMRAEALQAFRLVSVDLPGHGESTDALHPRSTYTLPGLARTLTELMAQMNLGPSIVFGWSLGGHVALEMMTGPAPIAALMITGAAPIARGPLGILRGLQVSAGTKLAGKRDFTDADVALFARTCLGDSATSADLDSIRRADGRLRKFMFRSMLLGQCADEKRVAETDPRPLAVVNGSDEPFAKPGYVAGLRYRALWRGLCHVIPEAGHAPFRTHPEQFNALLASFAGEVAAGRRQAEPSQAGAGRRLSA